MAMLKNNGETLFFISCVGGHTRLLSVLTGDQKGSEVKVEMCKPLHT